MRRKRKYKRRAKKTDIIKGTTKIKKPTFEYHFPNPGVTVEATSLEEAEKKLKIGKTK